LIWLGFCNHCNLACFILSIHHQTMVFYALAFNILDSLAEVLIFSLIISQALLTSKLSYKLSKVANLFENSTWYFSLIFTSSSLFRSNLSKSYFFLARFYLLKFSVLILPLPGSGQYHSQLL
jgi:hypothetical protein